MLTIEIVGVRDGKCTFSKEGLSFSGTSNGKPYALDLELLKEIDPEVRKLVLLTRSQAFAVAKHLGCQGP